MHYSLLLFNHRHIQRETQNDRPVFPSQQRQNKLRMSTTPPLCAEPRPKSHSSCSRWRCALFGHLMMVLTPVRVEYGRQVTTHNNSLTRNSEPETWYS